MSELRAGLVHRLEAAELISVIRTTLTRRGEGTAISDPIRVVTQYWSVAGELLAEVDPFLDPNLPSTATHGGRA